MIWLDRIEILGFKSFCEKTLIKIPDGITGIVGPNGCGKSNIVDALNWVLGEQSAKTLRSDKMEEVIFNGSKNRKPLSMAQVSLVWKTERDNPNSPEVVVARRLFRSGESQYEMNGEICRLKDVHAFFVNEGFDPLAYSILEQGKVDYLFNAKPLDRRTLIEEVAGVAEFKHKKRSAEMKLAENQLQLERVADILSEVEKQLSSLKRQAARARRFQLLKEERTTVQKISFHRRFAQMGIDYDAAMAKLQQCRAVEQTALGLLQHKELQADEMKLRLSELEAALYRERSAHHQCDIEMRDSQGSLQSKRQTIDELKRVIAEREIEIERLSREEVVVNQDWQVRSTEANELKIQTEDWIGQHTQLFAQMEAGAADVIQLQQQFEQIRKDILDVLSATTQLKTEQARLRTQHDHLEEDIRKKDGELASTRGQLDLFSSTVQTKSAELQLITEHIGFLDQAHAEVLGECEKLKFEWDELQSQLQVVSKQRSELEREMDKLDAQQHSSKYYNESARNLLNLPSRKAVGMMMDFIETDPRFETAVENFLADKLNYLIVNEENSALASIDYLKQQGLGYCGFVIKNGHDPNPPELPEELRTSDGVISSLREVVRIKPEALPAVAPFMQSAVLVQDLNCAQGLIKQFPEYQFVTVQGDVILSPVVYAGGAKAADMPGLIAIYRQQKELTGTLEGVKSHTSELQEKIRAIQERLEISNREIERMTEVKDLKDKDRLLVQMKLDQLTTDLGRETNSSEILVQELTQLRMEREAVFAGSEEALKQLGEHERLRSEREEQAHDLEQKLTEKLEDQEVLRHRVTDSRIRIAELKERERALSSEVLRLAEECQSFRNALEENRAQIAARSDEIRKAEQECAEIDALLLRLAHELNALQLRLRELDSQKETLTSESTAHEIVLKECRAQVDRARKELADAQVEEARIATQREDLLTRCLEEMGIELQSLPLPDSPALNELSEEDLRLRLTEIQGRIDRLGSINELALEEYVQMEDRHRFLKTQHDDLKVSIETLLETIKRIDATSLQRFNEAFAGVQEHFLNLFQRLFNGGKCEMVLIDPENPNESGIDIHVQPPGKRIQNIHLISGGEKALTGIAFLMALFQYHPSPFCVMDEVDAPLDDSNIQRFTSLIDEMKDKIQFVIVTHMKQTMVAASQLYGVTMAEPGVSNVLSAKFEEAEALIGS